MKFKSEIKHVNEGVQVKKNWEVVKDENGKTLKVHENETLEEAKLAHKQLTIETSFEVIEEEKKEVDTIQRIVNEIPEEVNEIKAEIVDDAINKFLEKQ